MNDGIEKNGNRINVKGNVYRTDLRPLCSALYQMIEIRKWSDVILDFSMCAGVAEAVLLPLMPVIADYRKKGVGFQLIEPQDDNLQRLFF
jgi:hypothetical protein